MNLASFSDMIRDVYQRSGSTINLSLDRDSTLTVLGMDLPAPAACLIADGGPAMFLDPKCDIDDAVRSAAEGFRSGIDAYIEWLGERIGDQDLQLQVAEAFIEKVLHPLFCAAGWDFFVATTGDSPSDPGEALLEIVPKHMLSALRVFRKWQADQGLPVEVINESDNAIIGSGEDTSLIPTTVKLGAYKAYLFAERMQRTEPEEQLTAGLEMLASTIASRNQSSEGVSHEDTVVPCPNMVLTTAEAKRALVLSRKALRISRTQPTPQKPAPCLEQYVRSYEDTLERVDKLHLIGFAVALLGCILVWVFWTWWIALLTLISCVVALIFTYICAQFFAMRRWRQSLKPDLTTIDEKQMEKLVPRYVRLLKARANARALADFATKERVKALGLMGRATKFSMAGVGLEGSAVVEAAMADPLGTVNFDTSQVPSWVLTIAGAADQIKREEDNLRLFAADAERALGYAEATVTGLKDGTSYGDLKLAVKLLSFADDISSEQDDADQFAMYALVHLPQ